MSNKMQDRVDELDLKGGKRDVLRTYADAANSEGVCYVGRAYICWVTGLSEKQVKRVDAELKHEELVVQVGWAEKGNNGDVRTHDKPGRGRFPLYKVQPEKGVKKVPYNEFKREFYSTTKGDISASRKGDIKGQERGTPVPQETREDPATHEPSEEDTTNVVSSSDGSEAPPSEKPEEKQAIGQWAIEQLFDKIIEARHNGWDIEDPPEVRRIGARYKELARRHDDKTLLRAFDYMVSQAAGQEEGEQKSWCGMDKALEKAKHGWEPSWDQVEGVANAGRRRVQEEWTRRQVAEIYGEESEADPPDPDEQRRRLAEFRAQADRELDDERIA